MSRAARVVAATFLIAFASVAPSAAAGKVRVVTTIPPLAMLVSQIGGDRVEVRSLLAVGADPHTYEPRPSDAAALQDADVVVSLGSSLDDWLGDAIRPGDGAVVVKLDAGDGKARSEEHDDAPHAEADDHDHEGRDPHVWLDPAWVREHAVAPLHRALAAADPEGAAGYGVAARAMTEDLSNLEDDIRESLLRATTRHFLAWHPAWQHFASRFSLHPAGSVGESGGREPSLRAMIAAVRAGRAAGVKAVLVEPQEDERHARVLADELGVPLVTVDPLGDTASADRRTYRTLMLFNAGAFARALGVVREEGEPAR